MNDTLTNRPDPGPAIVDQLRLDYSNMIEAVDAYDAEASELPAEISDERERHQFADVLSRMMKTAKRIENARASEKAPFLASERAVDGFFFQIANRLADISKDLNSCLTRYLNAIREQERAKQEAEAAEARRQAALAMKEAAEAQARAQAEQRASARREADEEASRQTQAADRHIASALVAEQRADDKAAEVVRGRSGTGKLSTLATTWAFEIEDLDELDIDRLRPFFSRVQLEQAVRAYVRAGHHELRGCRIYEQTSARVRG